MEIVGFGQTNQSYASAEQARLTQAGKYTSPYGGTGQRKRNDEVPGEFEMEPVGFSDEGSIVIGINETDQQVELSQSTWTEFLYECGVGVFNFSVERMKDAGIYHRFTKRFYPDQYQYDVAQHNLQLNELLNDQFKDNLSSLNSRLHYLDANNKQTANLFNRKQLISVLERIRADVSYSGDTGYVLPELTLMIQLLKASNSVHLNIREKAKISLSFDKISVEWKKWLEKKEEKIAVSELNEEMSGKERRQQWLTKIIDDLQLACKVQYVESAHEIITFELANGFQKLWKLGCVRSTSYKASLGATTESSALGYVAGGGLSGYYEELKFTDPEGYCNIFRWVFGGLSAEAKATFGAAVPGMSGAKFFIAGNANVQGIYGQFWEPKTPQTFATGEFKTLIEEREHRDNPNISLWFSRARLLDKKLSAQLNSELEGVLNEVEEIEQLRLDFNAIKESMDHRLSLYMSQSLFPEHVAIYASNFTNRETKEQFRASLPIPSNKPTFTSSLIKAPPDDITKATITGAVVKLVVGSDSKLIVGTGSEKSGAIGGGLGLVVYGSGKAIVRFRDEVKQTLTGLRFVDGTKSKEEKDSIRDQVAERFDDFKKTVIKNWTKETVKFEYTDLGKQVLLMSYKLIKPVRENYDSENDYLDALKTEYVSEENFLEFLIENDLDTNLVKLRERAMLMRSRKIVKPIEKLEEIKNELQECWELFEKNPKLTKKRAAADLKFDITNFDEMKECFNNLELEFYEYTKLQAGKVGRDYETIEQKQKALRTFEKRYGATRPEELIHRLHIASLYLLTNLAIEDPENEYLIDDILQFENALSSPPFAVDKNYLEDHLYFLEDLRITYFDAKLDMGTKAPALLEGASGTDQLKTDKAQVKTSGEGSVNAQFKIKVTYSWLGAHLNKWRRGQLLQLHVIVGRGVNVQATIKAIEPDFKKHLPEDLAQYALAKLKEKLLAETALSASVTRERTFDFTISKPDKFSEDSEGFDFSHLFSRKLQSEIIDLTGKITVPVGSANIALGGGYLNVKTDPLPLSEICEPNTVIQFFILCMHEYHVGGINKITGVVEADSHWNVVEAEQEKMLKQLFINFANEPSFEFDALFDFQPDKRPAGAISREIFEIEKAIHQNDNYLKQVRFIFETERRASADPATRVDLAKKIKALTVAINTHNKSNLLGRGLEEFNFRQARDNFKDAAWRYRNRENKKIDSSREDNSIASGDSDINLGIEDNDMVSGTEDNDINSEYKKALSCFKKLMFIDYPQWVDCRSNSPDLIPRPLTRMDNAEAMVVAQIQQAKVSLSGIHSQYRPLYI